MVTGIKEIRLEKEGIAKCLGQVDYEKTPIIKIGCLAEGFMEFDLIGVDPSFANGLRRVLISEVPTMAIEKVYILENGGVMHDEHLAHRLGLIPVRADAEKFHKKSQDDESSDQNTIVFEINVEGPCDVVSGDIFWKPQGNQDSRFTKDDIRIENDDILITKLGEGERIRAEMHCEKGTGKEHAKWSPVATASYRLHPKIDLNEEILGEDALKLQKCFPEGTIGLLPYGDSVRAVVENARKDTGSRECYRHEDLKTKVKLGRIPRHYIFTIESVGVEPVAKLVERAMDILIYKGKYIKEALSGQLLVKPIIIEEQKNEF